MAVRCRGRDQILAFAAMNPGGFFAGKNEHNGTVVHLASPTLKSMCRFSMLRQTTDIGTGRSIYMLTTTGWRVLGEAIDAFHFIVTAGAP